MKGGLYDSWDSNFKVGTILQDDVKGASDYGKPNKGEH